MVTFKIPFPPSVNNYWGNRIIIPKKPKKPFVSTFISHRGRRYRKDVQAAVLDRFGVLKPTQEKVSVIITAVMPDRRKRDLDNLLKASKDALTHAGVWGDDNQVDRLQIIRGRIEKPGWLEVTIEKIETH